MVIKYAVSTKYATRRLVDSSTRQGSRLCLKSQGSLNDLRSLPMFAEDTGAASSGCVDYYDGRETDNLNS